MLKTKKIKLKLLNINNKINLSFKMKKPKKSTNQYTHRKK